MTATVPALTRAERLDRLPFTREHGRLVVGSGLGWSLDAMDVGLISFVMASLAAQEQWGITPRALSWIGSLGVVGVAPRAPPRRPLPPPPRRPARRPARTTSGLRRHPADLRGGHRRCGALLVGRRTAGLPLPDRAR